MQQNVTVIPEERMEAIDVNELAEILAQLSGRTVEKIKNEGVQTTLVSLHLLGQIPGQRPASTGNG